ncbi:MAG: hypothetical protein U0166_04365 [Acidobacteriota bacterium]
MPRFLRIRLRADAGPRDLGLSELDAPDAAATLAALAKGPCDGAVDKESIDLWKRPLYVEAGNYAPACWARAVSP